MEMMVVDGVPNLLDFSEHTTPITNQTSEDDCYWNQWSPLLNLESFITDSEEFLIDTFLDDFDSAGCLLSPDHGSDGCISVSNASTEDDGGCGDLKGLRLVHLLMAAAEALTGTTACLDLVRVILVRLKELVSPTQGTTMERLAAHFTDALQSLLEGAVGAHSIHKNLTPSGPHCDDNYRTDMLTAFQLLHDMPPYVKFAHFTANQAILEAVAHERRVHIVDYDIMEGAQWAALIQAFSSSKEGPPSPHLRVTALSRSGSSGRKSFATVQETGRRLTAFAASLGQPFSFHQCRLDSDETFRPSSLKLVRGEALVFNCMLNLPHLNYRAHDAIASFWSGAKALGPKVVTLVEEVGPVGEMGFVGRFMDSLHYHSAIYDSLEAGFPMQSRARALVERVFLSSRIAGSVAHIYRAGGEEEERGSWGEWLGAAGFSGVPISFANHCQGKLLVGLFNDGYRVEELGKNKLVLGWKSRNLLSASVWTSISDSDF